MWRNKKIYALSPLLRIPHMYGKVTDECSAPQTIPMTLNTCTWNKLWFHDKPSTGLDT